jgi:toxin FitB
VKYLLDTNVLREMHPRGHKNVRLWLATVDDSELCISALTIKEIQKGIAREHARRPTQQTMDAQRRLDALVPAYRDRIVPIDREIAAEWGRLVGTKAKHNDDMALAATARVKGTRSRHEKRSGFSGPTSRGARSLQEDRTHYYGLVRRRPSEAAAAQKCKGPTITRRRRLP